MCVCCVCICICVYVCVYIYIYTHIHVCVCIYIIYVTIIHIETFGQMMIETTNTKSFLSLQFYCLLPVRWYDIFSRFHRMDNMTVSFSLLLFLCLHWLHFHFKLMETFFQSGGNYGGLKFYFRKGILLI